MRVAALKKGGVLRTHPKE